MARIAAGGIHHETNSFAPLKATLDDFIRADGWPALAEGKAMLDAVKGVNIPIAGFVKAMQGEHELVPLLWCSAQPSAQVMDDAYEELIGRLLFRLKAALPVDAVFLDLHGAMITESYLDGDGEILRRVRQLVGPSVPIVVSLDMHANVSRQMFDNSDWMVGYRTYPHVDMAECGARAGRATEKLLTMPRHPLKAMRKLPFIIPITSQCTLHEPMQGVMYMAKSLCPDGDALEVFTGFPPGDCPDTGPTLYACGFSDVEVMEGLNELQAHMLNLERAFRTELYSPAAAVEKAKNSYEGKPIIIADTQDNPGAGGNGDTVGMLEALIKGGARNAVFACLHDPANAQKAHNMGVGAEGIFTLGATSGQPGHLPFRGHFVIESLGDGAFDATGPMYGGSKMRLGPMAVLRLGSVRVVLSSVKQQCADRSILRHVGIEPEKQRILVLKSSVHFRADFEPIAGAILLAESPGPNPEDPEKLPYKHLRPGVRLKPLGRVYRPESVVPGTDGSSLPASLTQLPGLRK